LVAWATAAAPLTGLLLDEITIGIDEDVKLRVAVERCVAAATFPIPTSRARHSL
jgi:hypothetical protein